MEDYRSLSHTKWQCKYHIVFIPKYRKRQLYGVVRKHLGEVFHRLAKHKECWIEEGHVMPLFKERAKLRWQRIWARGFFVDTVGRDTETIRKYIAEQEMEDRRLDQLE